VSRGVFASGGAIEPFRLGRHSCFTSCRCHAGRLGVSGGLFTDGGPGWWHVPGLTLIM
jgi:hypothetical protein